jgi:hypothetical protein
VQDWETKKHNNADFRTGENLREGGDENNEQFSDNEIQKRDVVSWH